MLCCIMRVCEVMLWYVFTSNSIDQVLDCESCLIGGAFVWVMTSSSAVSHFFFSQGILKYLSLLRIC